jgi:phenylacetate-CoA ligase
MIFWREVSWMHARSPPWLREICASSPTLLNTLYSLQFGGRRRMRYLELLRRMHTWPADRVTEYQLHELRTMLAHAYNRVPYYRKLFLRDHINPASIKTLEDLRTIPILRRETLCERHDEFFSRPMIPHRMMYTPTSGTSGQALMVCKDDIHFAAAHAQWVHAQNAFGGYDPGKDSVLYAGNLAPAFCSGWDPRLRGVYSPFHRQVMFSWTHTTDNDFADYVRVMRAHTIRHVFGLPSILFVFAHYLERTGTELKVDTAFLGGEMLHPLHRRFIEKTLGCEVFDHYGQTEVLVHAYECHRHKGAHISPILGIAQTEAHSELIMTGICNRSWPLIRYASKDLDEIDARPCKCGCSWPRIVNVFGRENNLVLLPRGGFVHSMEFASFTVSIPGIQDIHFLQQKDYSLDVSVVLRKGADQRRVLNLIHQKIRHVSNAQLPARIQWCERIDRGKKKHVVVESLLPFRAMS